VPPDPSKVLREADDFEQSEEYDVDEEMSSVERGRGNNKRILYLVKWLDYPERKDWTEEPFNNMSVVTLEYFRSHRVSRLLSKWSSKKDCRVTDGGSRV